ncbi:MAG: hypothetical protein IT569_09670 [Leptospiraceae bacterium]|nr:hypothetical protein [Leptospiraceae bacterium]
MKDKIFINALAVFFIWNCNSLVIQSPNEKNLLLLNHSSSECKEVGKFSQWYVLFGSVPINNPDMYSVFGKDGSAYRIVEKATPVDIGLSVLFGIGGSFTKKTILVEACPSNATVLVKKDLEAYIEVEIKKAKEEFISKLEKENQEEWEKVQIAFHQDPDRTTVLLKSGEIKKGDIQGMGGDEIKLKVDKTVITIDKKEIAKIKFPKHAGANKSEE